MRRADRKLDTIDFRQSRAMCGPACLKVVFAYFGSRISERRISKASSASRASGTTGANLARGANRFGFDATIIDGASLRLIQSWLRKHVPVIVDWTSTVRGHPTRTSMAVGHYSVVRGLDRTHIFLHDPAVGRRRIPRKEFLRVWFDFRRPFPQGAHDLIVRRLIVVAPRLRRGDP
jgi:ABC-type bacteriocin/lantibiotic exporter with double-glycine peptidase domain